MKYRLDLHTHSIISYDGGITDAQYAKIFSDPKNIVAITDHNEVSQALELKQKFGEQVIVGEEILTDSGEIIGLFLNTLIPSKLSIADAISQIHSQGGLVYVPHPQELTRKGVSLAVLNRIADQIDILEIFNARSREPWLVRKNEEFTKSRSIAQAASSDAHSLSGFGTAYTEIDSIPNKENLVELIKKGVVEKKRAQLLSWLAPARNKFRKKFKI
jgi:predicted metal-dependent phosphoesterase TrpH